MIMWAYETSENRYHRAQARLERDMNLNIDEQADQYGDKWITEKLNVMAAKELSIPDHTGGVNLAEAKRRYALAAPYVEHLRAECGETFGYHHRDLELLEQRLAA
jgi:hypothetical protein